MAKFAERFFQYIRIVAYRLIHCHKIERIRGCIGGCCVNRDNGCGDQRKADDPFSHGNSNEKYKNVIPFRDRPGSRDWISGRVTPGILIVFSIHTTDPAHHEETGTPDPVHQVIRLPAENVNPDRFVRLFPCQPKSTKTD